MDFSMLMEAIRFHSREAVPFQSNSAGNGSKNEKLTKEPARYPCFTCGKKFTRSGTLRDHSRTHSNDRPFKCSSCNKSFARLKDRERHNKLHTEEKQFTCQGVFCGERWGCGRKFAREDGLIAHFRSVNGAKCVVSMQGWSPFLGSRRFGRQSCNIPRTKHAIGCGKNFDSVADALEHLNSSEGKTCERNFTVERARLSAQDFREDNERQQAEKDGSLTVDPDDFTDIRVSQFSPSNGPQGISLWIRMETRKSWKYFELLDVEFGFVATKELDWSVDLLPDTREYTIRVKTPPKPTATDAPHSLPVRLKIKYCSSGPAVAISLGTFTYNANPEDDVQTTKTQPPTDALNQRLPVEYVFPSAMIANYTPASSQLGSATTSASEVYSQAQRGMVNDHHWMWR